ncbi:MAG: VCBS repeat-containing protein [Kiritimatiellae bacterium]|nr:VCBS repeat-containing protein [Kiritimatiellia bacterium]
MNHRVDPAVLRSAGAVCLFALLGLVFPAASVAEVRYVSPFGAHQAPYTNWVDAATTIQAAIDAAADGDSVMVTNGVYDAGGAATPGAALLCRVVCTNAVTIESVEGPAVTSIVGAGPAGDLAVRCVFLGTNALLSGFTLTNGYTRTAGEDIDRAGGGAWASGATLTNCVISGNAAYLYGGGVCEGALFDCLLSGNAAYDGAGAYRAALSDCTLTANAGSRYAGGACESTLDRCTLTANTADVGAGAAYSVLNNCLLSANHAYEDGGATYYGTLNNCTVVANSAGEYCGGVRYSTVNNCIVYYNNAGTGPNYYNETFQYSCTLPEPDGTDNTTNEPVFADFAGGDFRLTGDSPCVNAGCNDYAPVGTDLDGNTRIVDATVDMGAYEYAWPLPFLDVTSADESVLGEIASADIAGTNNADVVGTMCWTNRLTGSSGTLAAALAWEVAGIGLAFGENVIVVTGTNTVGDARSDSVTITRTREHGGVSATHYVAPGGGGVWPYTNWTDAAVNLQDAVETAGAGDTVLVADGVYDTGGALTPEGGLSNRLVATRAVTIASVNGPDAALIVGAGPLGESAVRCAFLGGGAVLAGFTLTNGHTWTGGEWVDCLGGGAYAQDGALSNCVLVGNAAVKGGGGAYGATLADCLLQGNSGEEGAGAAVCTLYACIVRDNAAQAQGGGISECTAYSSALCANAADEAGGGAGGSTLYNCTLTGNSADWSGGGAFNSSLNNCVVTHNEARRGPNTYECVLTYCCTFPDPEDGTGNTAADPALAGCWQLATNSPCVAAGSAAYAAGSDIDAEDWADPPSIGCDEIVIGSVTGPLGVAVGAEWTNAAVDCPLAFTADIDGRAGASGWSFGDGAAATNQPYVSHAWSAPGEYAVVLTACNESYPDGLAATVVVSIVEQPTLYVDRNNAAAAYPFDAWSNAAVTIQDAIDACTVLGSLVLVSNGVYDTGAVLTPGYALSNRVCLTKAVTVRSVGGPEATLIVGQGPSGDSALRCAYLGPNTCLSGFTLTNGGTLSVGAAFKELCGGGAYAQGAVLTNCIFSGNSAHWSGGALYEGTAVDCTLANNTADDGGAAAYAGLVGCVLTGNVAGLGGGASHCRLTGSTLHTNSASQYGGGAYNCSLDTGLLIDNAAGEDGGGAFASTLTNCTISGNWAGEDGGGASFSTLYRSSVTDNSAAGGGGGVENCTVGNSLLSGNWAAYGGGSYDSRLRNCTVADNEADARGGGVCYGTASNSIVYYNTARIGENHYGATLGYSCTTPDPGYLGNTTDEPAFVNRAGGDLHAVYTSVCIDAGLNEQAPESLDLDGNPRLIGGTVDMGAYEYPRPDLVITNQDSEFAGETDTCDIGGTHNDYVVGTLVWTNTLTGSNGTFAAGSPWSIEGIGLAFDENVIVVTGTNALGDAYAASVTMTRSRVCGGASPVHYVATAGGNVWPYTNWATAATAVQDAVDAADDGDTVLVDDGTYQTGGGLTPDGSLSNRVCVLRPMTVQSVNGPLAACIAGGGAPGDSPVRCVYLATNALLAGFSLVSGATESNGAAAAVSGAGVWAEGATLSNCVLSANTAAGPGGGAYGGALYNCLLYANTAAEGGAAYASVLRNCTAARNTASVSGGGTSDGTLDNCIVYYNTAPTNANCAGGTLSYTCTNPDPGGAGNTTNAPLMNARYRLRSDSPCIDAGTASNAPPADLDGEPRWDDPARTNVESSVDMGADEFVDSDGDQMADAWEIAQFGGITNKDGTADGDSDGLNDLGEYNNGCDPASPDSDGDLMPDGWEVTYRLDPMDDGSVDPANGPNGDPDSDSLTNLAEYQNGADPTLPDTDNDGLTDGAEVNTYGTDPAARDSDGDHWRDPEEIARGYSPTNAASAPAPIRYDFDGDRISDIWFYDAPSGMWYIRQSGGAGVRAVQFGWSEPVALPGDYDDDTLADPALYHQSSGTWYILGSAGRFQAPQFGWPAAEPVPADYDGDGQTDLAVCHRAAGTWYLLRSTAGFTTRAFGWDAPAPVPADYDGDGRTDLAVYDAANGVWYLLMTTAGFQAHAFGWNGPTPVPADYDGDGRADVALYDQPSGTWYLLRTQAGFLARPFGWAEAAPRPADYDGDGKTDLCVRAPGGMWYVLQSSDGKVKSYHFGW